jgi:chromosome segregation protein
LVQRAADVNDLEDQIRDIEAKIAKLESRRGKEQQADQSALEATESALESLETLRGERDEARTFLKTLDDELKSAERSAKRLEEEIAKLSSTEDLHSKEHDLNDLESHRDQTLKALATRTADAEQFENQVQERELRAQQALNRKEQATKRLRNAEEAEAVRQNRAGNLEPVRQAAMAERDQASKEFDEAQTQRQLAEKQLHEKQEERVKLLETSLAISNQLSGLRNNLTSLTDGIHQTELRRARAESKRATTQQRLLEEYSLTEGDALAQVDVHEVPEDAQVVVSRLRRDLKAMGDVNLGAIEAYERITLRFDELDTQKTDIEQGISELHESIRELDKLTKQRFTKTFEEVSTAFSQMFLRLFEAGEGLLELSDPENVLESGVEMLVTLPGKRRQPLNLLSGGERSLCAAAFLFALLSVKPSPLVVLDEVDAPMDGRNVERFIALIKSFYKIQFIVITHNPTTIESAPVWLGVTMQEPGVSTLIPARFPDPAETAGQGVLITELD